MISKFILGGLNELLVRFCARFVVFICAVENVLDL